MKSGPLGLWYLPQAGVEYVDQHGEQRGALPKERWEFPVPAVVICLDLD